MPITPTAIAYEAWKSGTYQLKLARIKLTDAEFRAGEKELRYQWEFVDPTVEVADGDDDRKLFVSSGRNHGSTKSVLTKIINGIIGRPVELEEAKKLDLELFYGMDFEIMVTKETSTTGKESNKFQEIKRLKGPKTIDIDKYFVVD